MNVWARRWRALREMRALGIAVNTSMWAAGAPSMARTLPKARISRSTLFHGVPFMNRFFCEVPFMNRFFAACRS